ETQSQHRLLQRAELIGRRIGHTPVRLFRHWENPAVSVLAKLEWQQLSGSVKARAAYSIVLDAIQTGELSPDRVLLDATSGNTGIAYALIGKELGIRVALCLPENATAERKTVLEQAGAEIIFTSPFEGTDGAQEAALELVRSHPEKYFYADQYKNDNNWKAHFQTTGPELLLQAPRITHFVAGLGTTGTFTGVARYLKTTKPGVRLTALQPDTALHGLEGWKHLETAHVPAIYDSSLVDEHAAVSTEVAYETLKAVYKHDGILLSPSSAAALAGAFRVAAQNPDGLVVTVLSDNADRYGALIKKLGLC
ncbi:MAG TPA: pyridoxal-phosphate dependent enzyme, partial [Chitinophagales bacterium]|nr:pyridoxal-phosphate dependent enzyme [Chitinophagales bacterium]